jgi:nitroimidazol reductase NimA-like FMN-containing flavoprotein (pyridoxamine 5'-phosphate oxidase superfamily)
MVNDPKKDDRSLPAGPTLYFNENGGDDIFCPLVFDDAGDNEYRVVQLTSTHSFDTLQQALDGQLRDLPDPSEAAAVMLSPQTSETEVLTADVGTATTMFGFRINPEDLTGVSIAFSKLIQRWEQSTGSVDVCLQGIESLFPYHDTDLLYRFLNTILATLQGAGADVHMHLNPTMVDEQTRGLFMSLFKQVETIETAEAPQQTANVGQKTDPDTSTTSTAEDAETLTTDRAERTVEMTTAEIDEYLDEAGLGILAFAGDPPYAIPMSFGYDTERRELYLQLGTFAESEKQRRLQESESVTLVVDHYERPDRWRSVIVDGTLRTLSEGERNDREAVETFAKSKLASVDVFSMDPGEVTFSWYVLEPTSFSGRKGVNPT